MHRLEQLQSIHNEANDDAQKARDRARMDDKDRVWKTYTGLKANENQVARTDLRSAVIVRAMKWPTNAVVYNDGAAMVIMDCHNSLVGKNWETRPTWEENEILDRYLAMFSTSIKKFQRVAYLAGPRSHFWDFRGESAIRLSLIHI